MAENRLRCWYIKTQPHVVDLVGDIAGREPFLIHGESLIRYCLEQSRVNFQDGFQLLHAVYAVERFLSNLQRRGCDFDVVFFRSLRDLCVPSGSGYPYKYQFARTVIIHHLVRHARECAKNGTRASVLEFKAPESKEFVDYLQGLPVHFIMCHEGDSIAHNDTTQLRYLMYNFISSGKNVAVINSLEWKSSKVFAPLLSRSSAPYPSLPIKKVFDSPFVSSSEIYAKFQNYTIDEARHHSTRECLGIMACQLILNHGTPETPLVYEDLGEQIQAFLLHLAIMEHSTLMERQHWIAPGSSPIESSDALFLLHVIEVSLNLLENDAVLSSGSDSMGWDLYDAVDGFLFASAIRILRDKKSLPLQILATWNHIWSTFRMGIEGDLPEELPQLHNPSESSALKPCHHQTSRPSALPFHHHVLDEYLQVIKLDEEQESQDDVSHFVFQDLHHWHSTKPLLPPKKPEKLGFFSRKRKQQRLADIVAYSASLTNAKGKLIDPEIVVVKHGSSSNDKKKGKAPSNGTKEVIAKAKKGNRPGNKKGGREKALQAAQEVQQLKSLVKQDRMSAFWSTRCREIEKDSNLVSQYLKAVKFLLDRSDADILALGSEVYLFLCHILGQLCAKSRDKLSQDSHHGVYLIALIWNWSQVMSRTGASRAVTNALNEMATFLRMPVFSIPITSQTENLSFKFNFVSFKNMSQKVPEYRAMQLEHGGPYMERRFDSKPDERVPFEPDAWQRKVLDSIDADNSLLVVAPTSAGKTFISFYAMKKVLEDSDDGVLVYVAPTKALVNQIAAEIGARFTKSFNRKEGKSVWAIYTRDYRIQNPTGCQVLVTVPHILQIMLLAPTNAKGQNAWSRRIKRIIFDEVHCIGQNEDGVVWEQLLLSAPCPVIALSATVGNPETFRDWLSLVQERKGRGLDMIVHTARYSDLRKFIYEPRKWKPFDGFNSDEKIPVPGLDEGDNHSPNFQFVHPVAALTDRNHTALSDLSLEARDCLTLWRCLREILSDEEMIKFEVPAPSSSLPKTVAKSDILQWEFGLKRALTNIMETQPSTFQQIRKRLEPPPSPTGELAPKLEHGFSGQVDSLFHLAWDLQSQQALPALVFHYDTNGCERLIHAMFDKLESAETDWKNTSPEWSHKIQAFESWKKTKSSQPKKLAIHRGKGGQQDDDSKMSRLEQMQEEGKLEASPWESFDPAAPLDRFSFADTTKLSVSEANDFIQPMKGWVYPWLLDALRRGLGVHHAGMNRQYRQVVEIMFRKGFLRLVVATGTLALGINMPCKTVVFHGDSIFLTAQNYRQASGRAGRRGFDLLGNIVFNLVPRDRVYEIMSARLPGLHGQFPVSTTLVLRLLTLLHGSENCEFAVDMVQSLLSQTRLYLGGPESEMSVRHHVRFSIEYLRRQHLLSATGVPINFSGLVGHLYFTENAVFAFHSLLKGGYFHQLCSKYAKNQERMLLEMMLVLCHLFVRKSIQRTSQKVEVAHTSSSIMFLPRLPLQAEKLLINHNKETLSIFKGYVQSYISHNLTEKGDRTLPFTKLEVGQESSILGRPETHEPRSSIRSPFVALSGFTDDFETIHELCETVRGDVFLEESAIPYIPIWPYDTNVELNAYLLDFFKHGSMHVLTRDNGIKRGEVWFLLQEFSRTLATIIASLTVLINADETIDEDDMIGCEEDAVPEDEKPLAGDVNGADAEEDSSVKFNWSSNPDDDDSTGSTSGRRPERLDKVLEAFMMLRDQFDAKFRKEWA